MYRLALALVLGGLSRLTGAGQLAMNHYWVSATRKWRLQIRNWMSLWRSSENGDQREAYDKALGKSVSVPGF